MRARAFLAGVAIAAAYLGAAWLTFDRGWLPSRPLYDGVAPPEPYRFVDPPPELRDTNQQPTSVTDEHPFGVEGFPGATVITPDQQAWTLFDPDGIRQPDDADGIRVSIEPLDPDDVGDPPEGLAFEGNAYRITAVYLPTEEPVEIVAPATVLLRYPYAATQLMRRDGDRWVDTQARPGSGLELFAQTEQLGVFVNVGPPFHEPGGGRFADIAYAVGGLLVVVVGVLLGRRRTVHKRVEAKRRMLGKKAKPPKGTR